MALLRFDGAEYPDGANSDPERAGWMQGSPPPPDRLIRFADDRFLSFPQNRWALSHMRELIPTLNVPRGVGSASLLDGPSRGDVDAIESLVIGSMDGRRRSFLDALTETYVDGIAILHRGRLVYERYFGALKPELPHLSFSLTKSYAATIAATLVHEGAFKPDERVTSLLPELAGTAYDTASLRHLLDMEVGVVFNEDYADPQAQVWTYARAAGTRPRPAGDAGAAGIQEFLITLRGSVPHGTVFDYKSVNTEVLCWMMQRATGKPFATLLSERLWGPMGCEFDGYVSVDPTGFAVGGSGLSVTLRDLARFGELMRCEGARGGTQVVPPAVVAGIRRGGDRVKFAGAGYELLPGYSYRDMWWVSHDEHEAFEGRGIHGQRLYVAPGAEMVVARLASHPIATSAAHDPITMPALLALGRLLKGG